MADLSSQHLEDTCPCGSESTQSSFASTTPDATDDTLVDASAPTMAPNEPSSNALRSAGSTMRRGTSIGRYVIVDFLGAGGMGAVYAAYDPELDRKVAVKVMLHGGSMEEHERMRLVREAQALAKLQHPNVVAVYDAGQHEGRVFVAMEFVRGRTLSRWRSDAEHTWPEIVRVFLAAGRGLAAAHAEGLVHRDFKPDNVMLGDDGRVRVMDFGLAHAHGSNEATQSGPAPSALSVELTATGTMMGTPAYMAPEQFKAEGTDARTDQFSFCVALYEALVGRRPFRGTSFSELAERVCQGKLEPLPAKSSMRPHLRRILLRGMASEPRDRFASMQDLLEALEYDPRRRKRFVVMSLGTVLTAVGAFGGLQLQRARALAQCEAQGATIDADFNPTIAAELRDAAIGTGVAYAATTADHVVDRLQPYAARWAEHQTQSCVATTIERTVDEDFAGRIEACMNERRAALSELVAQLRHPDPKSLADAVMAAEKLDPIEQCSDLGWLRLQPAVEPANRAGVADVHEHLGRASSRIALGNYDEAMEAAQRALERARSLGLPALHARSRLVVGHVHELQGDFAAAERELVEAEYEAGAAGADDVAASSARMLVHVAHRTADGQAGLQWARRASMWLDRLGAGSEDVRRADLANHLGNAYHALGDLERAGAQYRRVLEIRKAVLGAEHPEVAVALNNLGGFSHSRGAFDDAAAYSKEALAIWEQTLGLEHPDVASTISNLGAIELARGDYATAIGHLRRAMEIRERTLGPDHVDFATTLHNLGVLYVRSGAIEQALPVLERALAIRRVKLAADHPHLLSTIEAIDVAKAEHNAEKQVHAAVR